MRISDWSSDVCSSDLKAIDYEYGADQKRVRLRAIGPDGNDEGFAVRFPNGLVLDVVPQGTALHVSDRSGKYSKTFEWQYEGPVDGRGTFCTPCVEEAGATGRGRAHVWTPGTNAQPS